jgi:hypothetical protein
MDNRTAGCGGVTVRKRMLFGEDLCAEEHEVFSRRNERAGCAGDVGSYTTIAMDMVRRTLSLRMFFLLESDYGLVGRLGKCVATGGVCKVVKNPSPHVYT